MIYRPPFKGFWKQISILIAVIFSIFIIVVFIQIGLQKRNENDLRQTPASGIVVEKKDLNRGNFLIIIIDNGQKKEYSLSGFDEFYDKIKLGDSVEKNQGSFYFQVFRRTGSKSFEYIHTIGYD